MKSNLLQQCDLQANCVETAKKFEKDQKQRKYLSKCLRFTWSFLKKPLLKLSNFKALKELLQKDSKKLQLALAFQRRRWCLRKQGNLFKILLSRLFVRVNLRRLCDFVWLVLRWVFGIRTVLWRSPFTPRFVAARWQTCGTVSESFHMT